MPPSPWAGSVARPETRCLRWSRRPSMTPGPAPAHRPLMRSGGSAPPPRMPLPGSDASPTTLPIPGGGLEPRRRSSSSRVTEMDASRLQAWAIGGGAVMNPRARTALLLAGVCVLSWLTFAWLTVRQCTREGGCYQGRTLTEWSRELLGLPLQPTAQRLRAVDVLGGYGARAVPALVKALHDPAPEVRQRAVVTLARVGQ